MRHSVSGPIILVDCYLGENKLKFSNGPTTNNPIRSDVLSILTRFVFPLFFSDLVAASVRNGGLNIFIFGFALIYPLHEVEEYDFKLLRNDLSKGCKIMTCH